MGEELAHYTFGGWRLTQTGETITSLGSRKVEALLTYLAATAHPQPRELLAELLWDNRSQKLAMSNLRRVLTGLRKVLGPHVEINRETAAILPSRGLWLDAHEIRDKLAPLAADRRPLSADDVAGVDAALALYEGPFLAGFSVRAAGGFESWLTAEREYWQQQILTALGTLAAYYESVHLVSQGIFAARRAIQIDNLQETAYQQLMRLLALDGRRSEALNQYEICRQLLWDELGVRPAPQTEALVAAIAAGELPASGPSPSPAANPERSAMESAQGSEIRSKLPPQSTPFIGREEEIANIGELMAASHTHLLTIVGPGGMGKTRLALAVAEQFLDERSFPDGVIFVNLAPISEARHMVPTLADALGFRLVGGAEAGRQQIISYLKRKELLLIFDSFEHLLSPAAPSPGKGTGAGADFLADIVKTAPRVKILVTSRERLHLQMEQLYPLEGLAFPDWETGPPVGEKAGVEGYAAVQLFLQAARRSQPDFSVTARDDLPYLAQICRLVAGMPLAIELAASWVDMLSPADIAAELQHGLDLLEAELRDMPARHRSIRAALESSWQKLTIEEQTIFAQLSIFRGGFTREAVQAVVGANLSQLSRLAHKSLLKFDTASNRYQIHELLRQFGEEKLTRSGSRNTALEAHNQYYLTFVHERTADIKGRRQLPALAEIRAEFENIRFAWFRAARRKNFQGIDRAIEGLMRYFEANLAFPEAVEFQQKAMSELAPEPGRTPHPVWFKAAARHQKPREKEIPLLQEALARARQKNDRDETAQCLDHLGIATFMTGDQNGGLSLLKSAIRLSRTLDDLFFLPVALGDLSECYARAGKIKQAYRAVQESLNLFQRIGDQVFSARYRINKAELNFLRGHFEASERDFIETASQYREFGQLRVAAFVSMNGVHTAILRGQFAEAGALFQEQAAIFGEIDDLFDYREFVGWLANLDGEYAQARETFQSFQASLPAPWAKPFQFWLAIWGQAVASSGLGDYAQSGQELQQAIRWAVQRQQKGSLMLALPIAALLMAHTQNPIKAVELFALSYRELAGWTGWLEQWDLFSRLRADLEAACGEADFARAWQRGSELDLWAAAESLLDELTRLDTSKGAAID